VRWGTVIYKNKKEDKFRVFLSFLFLTRDFFLVSWWNSENIRAHGTIVPLLKYVHTAKLNDHV